MRFALNVPNFGAFSDPNTLMELAAEAERAGWDGVLPLGPHSPVGSEPDC